MSVSVFFQSDDNIMVDGKALDHVSVIFQLDDNISLLLFIVILFKNHWMTKSAYMLLLLSLNSRWQMCCLIQAPFSSLNKQHLTDWQTQYKYSWKSDDTKCIFTDCIQGDMVEDPLLKKIKCHTGVPGEKHGTMMMKNFHSTTPQDFSFFRDLYLLHLHCYSTNKPKVRIIMLSAWENVILSG